MVTPVLQPIIELTSPIDRVYGTTATLPSGTQEDSFYAGHGVQQIDVVAGLTTTIATLARGAWVLELWFALIAVATASQNVHVGWMLVDVEGNPAPLLAVPWGGSANVFSSRIVHVALQRDGWVLRTQTITTAAGERLSMTAAVNARRII
jgi:hypothetical protein